jgi:hypothetical protein
LVIIRKEEFIEMGILGLIDNKFENKNYYISGKGKNAKNKKYFMCEPSYKSYLRMTRNKKK